MGTVLVLERHPVHPDAVDAFAEHVRVYVDAMRASPGLLWVDAAVASDDVPSWLVLSEWRTGPDADAWTESATRERLDTAADALRRGDVTQRRFADATD